MSTATPASPTAAQDAVTVDELCDYIGTLSRADQQLACDFARIFFTRVPRALLEERSVEELGAMTIGAWEFLQRARPDQVNVEVADPRDEGWKAPVTVIRTEVGDRPFIVDTIREYLNAENIPILHYVYPVLRVERGADGAITTIGSGQGAPGGEGLEALGHVEIPHVARRERAAEIRDEVHRRLSDVVEATRDFRAMVDRVERVQSSVASYLRRFPEKAQEYGEYLEFLGWLRAGNFVFLGARNYQFTGQGDEAVVSVEPGSGLGILADEGSSQYAQPRRIADMDTELRTRVTRGPLLIVSKANRESTVHRRAPMDYVGVKRLDEQGFVVGEWRFLGLFTSQAYAQNPNEIPILRRKAISILDLSGTRPGSHDYKEIVSTLNEMPKEELFQASAEQLRQEVEAVLGHLFSDEVRVVLRPDGLRREAAVMVILPRGRFSNRIRREIGALLEQRLGAALRSSSTAGAADQARLHYWLVGRNGAAPLQGAETETVERELERAITQLLRSWDDVLEEQLLETHDASEARRLARAYGQVLGADYRAANVPAAALPDVLKMDEMLRAGEQVSLLLRAPVEGELVAAGATVLRLYLAGERLVISDFMPILEDHGVKVLEVDTFEFQPSDSLPHLMAYSFHVQTRAGEPIPTELYEALAESLLASRNGVAERDAYAALTLLSGLRWREVDVVRTYANYASQIGAVPSRMAPVRAFVSYPHVARLLIRLFHARFDPERQAGSGELQELRQEILVQLEKVVSLADDRALRRLMNLVEATVRTNYFRHGGADPTFTSGGVPYISVKVRSADVEELKKTRLLYEIYVHSARMEGVHLRAAPVSRGGIRWSDRPDDFRTEILGLVLTQVVKNATIVPSGSKGGFITKRQYADRDAQMEEARQQYMTLMRGLLDVTDNLVDGKVVPPPMVVRHDGDDPYLVVAADKGTAHLSDTANAVAAEYGFWLDDAFASGGSQGYDHKKEGITARGAWECVKRHFREMGTDIQTTPFTVAGVGDMSGDVFGNGMLLSPVIRLVAAFDHRHIFIDPDPDPARSFAERMRMFDLPRSSWDDYDRSVLSAGAMIVPRASKTIEITPEARRALGLGDEVEKLDGEGLVRAVLKAPVDLLWNGGIGTYVKSEDETNADVGDTSNDPVRIDAGELRCRVVGEGGNLGFTQKGRIAAAMHGVRLNTDALDNSAGVDMSDHEVNLKILVGRVVRDGDLDMEGRNRLLHSMTDDVNRLVLRNNFGQSLAISLDELRSKEALDDFVSFIDARARDGRLDPAAEGMPDADELRARRQGKLGLTRPTLCVLLAHAKLQAKLALLDSTVPDDPATDPYLVDYFPPAAVEAAGPVRLREHRLRREIVTTELVNDLVNLMGSSFLHRVSRDTGQGIADVVRAWLVASRIAGAAEIRADMNAAEGRYPAETIYRWLTGLARVLEQTTQWLLANVPAGSDTPALIEEARGGLSALRGSFARFVAGEDRNVFLQRLGELQDLGVEKTLGERLITLRFLPQLLEIVTVARAAGTEEIRTAKAFYAVSEKLGTARLRDSLRTAAGDDAWERRYAGTLAEDLTVAQRAVVAAVLRGGEDPGRALNALEKSHAREFQAYRGLVADLRGDNCPLAAYALAVRQLQTLARSVQPG